MVSKLYQQFEDTSADVNEMHDDQVREIARKIGKDPALIDRVLYRTCIGSGARIVDAALIIDEFFSVLGELEREEVET